MSRPFEQIASLYSVYYVHFRNLPEEHNLGAGEELSEMVDFALVGPRYSVRIDRIDEDAEYEVSTLNDMEDMSKDVAEATYL